MSDTPREEKRADLARITELETYTKKVLSSIGRQSPSVVQSLKALEEMG